MNNKLQTSVLKTEPLAKSCDIFTDVFSYSLGIMIFPYDLYTGIRRLVTWQWFDAVISKLLLDDACSSNLLHTFNFM